QSERKRERARVAHAVRPVKEYERPFARFIELKRGLPWTRVPAAIFRGHNLGWRTPFRKRAKWTFGSAPPQSRLRRRNARPNPNASEDRIKSTSPRANAEIEHLHFRRSEERVFAPSGAAIRAFGVPMNKIVLLVRSRDVPHSPHPIVIDEVGLVHASVFPLFVRDKYWFRLILPLGAVPLQEANRIRRPKVVCGARIVNALGSFDFAWASSPYIIRPASSTVAVRLPTTTPSRYRCQISRCVADQLPAGR